VTTTALGSRRWLSCRRVSAGGETPGLDGGLKIDAITFAFASRARPFVGLCAWSVLLVPFVDDTKWPPLVNVRHTSSVYVSKGCAGQSPCSRFILLFLTS